MYDVVVIGKGLVGSAAARYLSAAGAKVLIVGPDEPASIKNHQGVFASHYDQARLAYHSKRDPIWTRLAARSIAKYSYLEQQSGIGFHTPVGYLGLARKGSSFTEYENTCARIEGEYGFQYRRFTKAQELSEVYPEIALPDGFEGFLDPAPSGYINPRKLILAQLAIAVQQGAEILRETVAEVSETKDHAVLRTLEGREIAAQKVLVATGSFANSFKLLPMRPALWVKNEFVTLAEVSEVEAERCKHLPVMGYEVESEEIQDVYLVPPVRYPDGRYYFKIGSNTDQDHELSTLEAIQAWMHSEGKILIEGQCQVLRDLFPKVQFAGFAPHHCLISRTPSRLPFIDQATDHTFMALGCNGTSAMSSDALGDLASRLILDQPWDGFARGDMKMIEA